MHEEKICNITPYLMAKSPKFPRGIGNRGRGTLSLRPILDRKRKYGMRKKKVQYNCYYRNSSVIVDLAMGQIPRFTEITGPVVEMCVAYRKRFCKLASDLARRRN